jgi:hypothetical protein
MDYVENVKAILHDADQKLRNVIAEAAKNGDLQGIDIARRATGRIRQIIESPDRGSASGSSGGENQAATRRTRCTQGTAGSSPQRRASSYPTFWIENEILYKAGWSKKKRREYVHKTSRVVFDRTIRALQTLKESGAGPFAAEQIIETVNDGSAEPVPNYQIYLVLSCLDKQGALSRVGREGYEGPGNFFEKARSAWAALEDAGM